MNQNSNPDPSAPQKQTATKLPKVASSKTDTHKREPRRASHRVDLDLDGLKDLGSDEVDRLKQLGGESIENLREMGTDLGRRVSEQIQERPLMALGVAFGTGVIMSTLLTSKLGRLALLAGGGYVAKQLLGDRLMDFAGDDEDIEIEVTPRRKRARRHG